MLSLFALLLYTMSRCVDNKGFTTVSSRNTKSVHSSSNNKNNSVSKFCSVCKNAGKSEKEYTSHFPKSSNGPEGVVICPTILNNECSYCHKLGHYKQQCPVLEAKKNGTLLPKQKENIEITPVINKKENVKNFTTKFAVAFESDSESDSDISITENKKVKIIEVHSYDYAARKYFAENNITDLDKYVYNPNREYDVMHDWCDFEYWGLESN